MKKISIDILNWIKQKIIVYLKTFIQKKNKEIILKNNYITIFNNYYEYFEQLKAEPTVTQDNNDYKKYQLFLEKSLDKLTQCSLLISLVFNENNKLIINMTELCNEINACIDYLSSGVYRDNHKDFISDVQKIIKLTIKIIEIL